jgi:membrane protein DedA with SNARE-associated domain
MLHQLTTLMTDHPGWAGALFGLLAFGESLAIVGTIIPATPILFFVGTLVGSGRQDALAIIPPAIVGAIAGYWLSWAVGQRLGSAAYRLRPFAGQRRRIARLRLFFRRWGGPSLVVGRYVLGPLQSTLPLVAGAARMDARRFHLWNTASGVLWVFVVLAPGYLAGRGLISAVQSPERQQAILVAVLVLSTALIVGALVLSALPLLKRARA